MNMFLPFFIIVYLPVPRLTNAVCGGIEDIADQVCEAITAEASPADPHVNNTITNIYLQVSQSHFVIHMFLLFKGCQTIDIYLSVSSAPCDTLKLFAITGPSKTTNCKSHQTDSSNRIPLTHESLLFSIIQLSGFPYFLSSFFHILI